MQPAQSNIFESHNILAHIFLHQHYKICRATLQEWSKKAKHHSGIKKSEKGREDTSDNATRSKQMYVCMTDTTHRETSLSGTLNEWMNAGFNAEGEQCEGRAQNEEWGGRESEEGDTGGKENKWWEDGDGGRGMKERLAGGEKSCEIEGKWMRHSADKSREWAMRNMGRNGGGGWWKECHREDINSVCLNNAVSHSACVHCVKTK